MKKLTDSHKEAISKGLFRASKEGRIKTPERRVIDILLNASRSPSVRAKAAATFSAKMKGRPQRMDCPTGAHSDNQLAKDWSLKDPDRKLHVFKNLNQFVRDNECLFLPQDVVWKNGSCNATRSLASLTRVNKKTGRALALSWKGWTE